MGPENTMWWPMTGMWIFPILFFVMIIFAMFFFMGRGGCGPRWTDSSRQDKDTNSSESALDILKKRYARGEITKDEFEQMKRDIQ